jgi:mannosyl-3-phosphoglycerate phosphatase
MTPQCKIAVFTDVDGTLLNNEYEYTDINSIINKLLNMNASLILCSSKTRVELEYYQHQLGISEPFISENGAAIFIPKNYFQNEHSYSKRTEKFDIVELGVSYEKIRETLKRIREKSDCEIFGFGDMKVEEIAKETGLSIELASFAKQREYSEPVKVSGDGEKILDLLAKEGLCHIRGDRFCHLTGNHNKGKAVSCLKRIYECEFHCFESFAVGNGPNDLSMLKVVSHPYFVKALSERGPIWSDIVENIAFHLTKMDCK